MFNPEFTEKNWFKTPEGIYVCVSGERDAENPLTAFEPLGTFYTWGRNFISPSANPYRDAPSFVADKLGNSVEERCESTQDVLSAFRTRGYAIKVVYRFEHSAVAYRLADSNPFGDQWDSGPVGFAFVSPEKLEEEGLSVDQALSHMDGEMKEYSAWANGDVWRVETFDEQGGELDLMVLYGLDDVESEFPHIEPVDFDGCYDLEEYLEVKDAENEFLVLNEKLNTEWEHHLPSNEFPFEWYECGSDAIVAIDSDNSGWRCVNLLENIVAPGEFPTATAALAAFEKNLETDLSKFIPPKDIIGMGDSAKASVEGHEVSAGEKQQEMGR